MRARHTKQALSAFFRSYDPLTREAGGLGRFRFRGAIGGISESGTESDIRPKIRKDNSVSHAFRGITNDVAKRGLPGLEDRAR